MSNEKQRPKRSKKRFERKTAPQPSASQLFRQSLPAICMIPDCGCSGEAHA